MDIDGDDVMLPVVEGKLARITQDVPTLRMERIPIAMQEHVVGVPLSWLRLLRRVTRVLLGYKEAVEVAPAEESNDHR